MTFQEIALQDGISRAKDNFLPQINKQEKIFIKCLSHHNPTILM